MNYPNEKRGMTDYSSSEWIPLLVPDMPTPNELLPWLERMHAKRHYSNFGPLVCELEELFSQQFGVNQSQVTTVANATQGLEIALQALELPRGSSVLLPAFTFVATATSVVRAGHIPVIADVDAQCWMLTPEIARETCERMRIDAVLPVTTFGMPHDLKEWQIFEEETSIPVVIDAAAAYGSQWLQGAKGTLVFSLHTTKSLPAAEGGLVVSTRDGFAKKVRQLSNFGINTDSQAEIPVGVLASLGTNAKMSEYHAAICFASMQRWEESASIRRRLQKDLMCEFDRISKQSITWQIPSSGGDHKAPSNFCMQLKSSPIRAALEKACLLNKIMTRRWYQPLLGSMSALRDFSIVLDTPNSEKLAQTALGLPFFPDMTVAQCSRIIDVVDNVFKCEG